MIKIVLPNREVTKAINEAKEDCLLVMGFFIKYHIKFHDFTLEIEPKEGIEFDPSDIFHLAWYVKEYI